MDSNAELLFIIFPARDLIEEIDAKFGRILGKLRQGAPKKKEDTIKVSAVPISY